LPQNVKLSDILRYLLIMTHNYSTRVCKRRLVAPCDFVGHSIWLWFGGQIL